MFRKLPEPQSSFMDDFIDINESDYYKTRFADIISEFADNEGNVKAKDVYNALIDSIKEELEWHLAASKRLRGLLDLVGGS